MVAALTQAAAEEFADRGYNAASVRAIGARARVNHGLVHRHFGSKANLLHAVLDDLSDRVARELTASPETRTRRTSDAALFQRVLARAMLDGADLGGQRTHPIMDWAVAQAVDNTGGTPDEVRMGVLHALALELGWSLFEPFLVGASGLTDDAAREAREEVAAAQRALVQLSVDHRRRPRPN